MSFNRTMRPRTMRSLVHASQRGHRPDICKFLQRNYATTPSTPPAPPLLLKLRNDLKTSMKAKDSNRLNVVRGILNEVTNAAKSSSPIKTDMQMLALLRKRAAAAKVASKEFDGAGRADLKDKEDAQISVLDEYAGGVETTSDDEIRNVVSQVVGDMRSSGGNVAMGDVLKRLLAPGGDFEGKPVEKAVVAKMVKEILAQG